MSDLMGNILMLVTGVTDKKTQLQLLTYLGALFAFAFLISSFVVAGTANAGFNVVLTAFLNCAWVAGAYFVIGNSKTPIAIGFLIGSTSMICAMNFLTAVYWGQLSKCQKISYSVDHYSCSNRVAYGSVCAFAVLLFLVQFAFSIASILWRGDLISEAGLYDDISAGSGLPSHMPYDQIGGSKSSAYPSSSQQSADL